MTFAPPVGRVDKGKWPPFVIAHILFETFFSLRARGYCQFSPTDLSLLSYLCRLGSSEYSTVHSKSIPLSCSSFSSSSQQTLKKKDIKPEKDIPKIFALSRSSFYPGVIRTPAVPSENPLTSLPGVGLIPLFRSRQTKPPSRELTASGNF